MQTTLALHFSEYRYLYVITSGIIFLINLNTSRSSLFKLLWRFLVLKILKGFIYIAFFWKNRRGTPLWYDFVDYIWKLYKLIANRKENKTERRKTKKGEHLAKCAKPVPKKKFIQCFTPCIFELKYLFFYLWIAFLNHNIKHPLVLFLFTCYGWFDVTEGMLWENKSILLQNYYCHLWHLVCQELRPTMNRVSFIVGNTSYIFNNY
jgi:hypothetical protein